MKRWRNALSLCLALTLCLAVLGVCPAALAAGEASPVLTVAFPEAPGLNEVYEDGTYGGCVYGWLEEIAKYTGWTYEFVTGDAGELTGAMMDGAYDLMGGMYLLEGFDELYNYPKYVMGSNYNLLIFRQDDLDIKSYDYTTMNGKSIGVYSRAAGKIDRLKKFLDFNNLTCELIYFDDLSQYENCLETGEADLLLGSDVHMKDHYNVAAQFDADPYYIVTAKDKPELCAQLSQAMESIYAANPNFASDLYKQYFPNRYLNTISFTEEEMAFVRQSGPLKVAVVPDCFPLFYEKDGKDWGVVKDCLELISQRTGLTFEYVFAESDQDMIDMVVRGEADLIGAFCNSSQFAARQGLATTVSYLSLDTVILRNKNSFDSSGGLVMAVPQGRDLEPDSADDTIRYFVSYPACMEAVNRGDADYLRMPAAYSEDYYARGHYSNIIAMTDINLPENLSLALPTPINNVSLYSVLSKALNNFSEEETAQLLLNNTVTTHENPVTLRTLLYTNPVMVIGVCAGILLLLTAIVILLNFSRTRARVMQLKLEKAEETSRAKSDFLSRMSHEIRTPMNAIIGLTNLTRMTGEVTPAVDESLSKIDSSAQFLLALLNDVLDMSKIESQKMQLDAAPFDLARMTARTESMFAVQARQQDLTLAVACNVTRPYFVGDEMRLQQVLTNLLSNACKFTDRGGNVRLSIEELVRTPQDAVLRFSVKDTGAGILPEDMESIFHAFEQGRNSNRRTTGTGLGLAISSSLVALMEGALQVESTPGVGSEFYFTVRLPVCEGVSPAEQVEELPETRLKSVRVLLAEDNDINAEIAMELLKNRGMAVDWAADGQQAVELFASSPPWAYDILLMDINMPILDGLSAVKLIRAMERPDAATVPILAMTANTFQEDRDNAAQAGMSGFLPKPFDVAQLYRILLEALAERDRALEPDSEVISS